MSCRRTLVPHEGQIGTQVTAHVAFGSYDRLGLCDFFVFMAHPIGLLCTLHARAVPRATLATERPLRYYPVRVFTGLNVPGGKFRQDAENTNVSPAAL
jgi:hypothetical protein